MINEADIQSALTDIRNELKDTAETVETVLTNVSIDYAIDAKVLRARFERSFGELETYGQRHRAYVARQCEQVAEAEANEQKAVEQELAERRAIAEFFASDRGLGNGVVNAARRYLEVTR